MVIRVTVQSEVGRKPGEVFAFMADGENDMKWNAWAIESKKISEGPIGAGTRFRGRLKRFGETTWHIGAFEPSRRLTLVGEGQPAGVHTITLDDVGGGTRV